MPETQTKQITCLWGGRRVTWLGLPVDSFGSVGLGPISIPRSVGREPMSDLPQALSGLYTCKFAALETFYLALH